MRTHSHASALFLIAFVAGLQSGCEKDRQERTVARSTASAAPSSKVPDVVLPVPGQKKQDGNHPLKVAITWTDPPGWTRVGRTSPMRAATYKIPLATGDEGAGEMAVFYFGPGQGGDIDGNVERWAKQFGKTLADVKRTNREVNSLKQHVVEIPKGDFSPGMMGGGKTMKDFAMLAAIVQAPSGSYFFKLTGPEKSVAAQRDAFYEMLDSIKSNE